MTAMTTQKPTKNTSKTSQRQRLLPTITFELVKAIGPTEAKAETMSSHFGLEPVDYATTRENVEEQVVRISNEVRDNLNDKAMQMFLQRLIYSFVFSAYKAADYYGQKKSDALALHSKLMNEDRDEDREPVWGFDSRTQRAAAFCAEMGLQAYALAAAAEGACSAYEHIVGEPWKPRDPNQPQGGTLRARSTAEMIKVLQDE